MGILLSVSVPLTNASAVSIARTIVASDRPSQTEGSIVVNPKDNSLAAGFSLATPFRSSDGGANWSNYPIAPVADNGFQFTRGDQWTAIDTSGKIYSIIWYYPDLNLSSPSYLSPSFMVFSNDTETTWQIDPANYTGYGTTYTFLDGTTTTSCKPSSGAIFSSDYAKLAIDTNPKSPYRNDIYILANVAVNRSMGSLNGCFIQNVFIRSADSGRTWDKHTVLTPELADFGFIQKIAIGPNGELYFAKTGGSGIEFYKSLDAGATFAITNVTTSTEANVVNVAVSPSNTLYMAYVGVNQSSMEGPCVSCAVYLTASANGGNSWSNPSIISEPGAVPYFGPPGPNPGWAPFGPERSTVTVSATPSRVFVAWRDWTNAAKAVDVNGDYNATNGDYYAYDSSVGLIRLTTYTGRFCAPPNKGDCTTFAGANDYMDSTASGETIYAVYGIDANHDMTPDANFVSLKIVQGQTAVEYLLTYGWAILIPILVLTIALYKKRKRGQSRNLNVKRSSHGASLHDTQFSSTSTSISWGPAIISD